MTEALAHIKTAAELTSVARALQERSAERYRELAVAFDVSCNLDTAAAFRALADDEDSHAQAFPPLQGTAHLRVLDWFERSPEIADPDSVHYMMLPWHAHDLALRAETRVQEVFTTLASDGATAEVRALAAQLAEQEATHLDAIRARRDACPAPHAGWWEDQDGPNWDGD